MVRVAAISYLNTLPFVYGLEHSSVLSQIEMVRSTPAQCADKLARDEVDLGIVPAAVIPLHDHFQPVTDYCIGAEGPVISVLICSQVPLNQIRRIYADVDSRTSLLLTRTLCRKYWHIQPEILPFDYAADHLDADASYLLIGDKAMLHASEFRYTYDLAAEWIAYTGKPFVFACWVCNKPLDAGFIAAFNKALDYGVHHIGEAVEKAGIDFPKSFAIDYLTRNISYTFNESKRNGLTAFLSMAYDPSKFRVRW